MSYQVLARKWRPQKFTDVIGQEHVLTALVNSISLGRIHHAYLLSGTRGVGKTTIARLLAKGLNCETGITATPCGQCNNCNEIKQGCFIDLIEIDAASRTKVEDIRELLDNIQYTPARGRFKIYIIDEVHMLSRHSFNALLKNLEEPPAHVKFVLATTDPHKLPVTILSRCLQFYLKALKVEHIRGQLVSILQQENVKVEPRALQLLANAAKGSMRDALSLTDQAIAIGQRMISEEVVRQMLGTINIQHPLAIIESLVDADCGAIMELLSQCSAHGIDWESLLVEMLSVLHRIAMGQLLPDQFNENEEEQGVLSRLKELTQRVSPADLQLYYQTLLVGRKDLPYAPDRKMGVEMTMLRALAFHPTATVIHTGNTEEKLTEYASSTRACLKTTATKFNRKLPRDTTGAKGITGTGPQPVGNNQVTGRQDLRSAVGGATLSLQPAKIDSSDTSRRFMMVDNLHNTLPTSPSQTTKPQGEGVHDYSTLSSTNDAILPDATMQLLLARTTLLHHQGNQKKK